MHLPHRPRRLRAAPWIRKLVSETTATPSDLIWPIFVQEGHNTRTPIASMPGVERLSIDLATEAARQAHSLGIPALALFPATPVERKTPDGKEALNPDNLVCRALSTIKSAVPEVGLVADVALDPYTTHGHDGLLDAQGYVANDATVETLAAQALTLARAGADMIAPSDMMDGRVGAIRQALEDENLPNIAILAYTAKYASAFYGPFRDAVGSASQLKTGKATYQMNPANAREALREAALDSAEGADMLMVKPGMPYLDILQTLAQHSDLPVLAYQVSGEYAMLAAATANGWLDARAAWLESLIAFKRAGASAVLTYAAPQLASWLQE